LRCVRYVLRVVINRNLRNGRCNIGLVGCDDRTRSRNGGTIEGEEEETHAHNDGKASEDAKEASREALEKTKVALQAEIDKLATELSDLQQKHMPQLESKLAQAKDKLVAINKQLSEDPDAVSCAMYIAPVTGILFLTLM